LPTESFDVCVIGTGAGGGVMLKELTAAGMRVVALERGPELSLAQFTDDELAIMWRDTLFSPDQVETYRIEEGAKTETGRFNAIAHCVGGTMTHWAAWSWRFRPDEFKVLSTDGPVAGASLADWPVDYAELDPFYEKAEKEFGISGSAGANPFEGPRKKAYPNPPHPPKVSGDSVAKGARALGYTPFPTPMGINSRPYDGRPPCMYGGSCQQFGCPIHAKATPFSVLIPKARKTGKLDLRSDAMVFEIPVGEDGRARGARYLDPAGNAHEVRARHVIVAGGAIGSPHLLRLSSSSRFPDGLGNGSGQVGRHLTFHVHNLVQYLIDEPSMSWTGLETHMAIDDLHPSDPKRGFIRGGVIGEINFGNKLPIAHGLAGVGFPGLERQWGSDFKDYLRTFPHVVGIASILEDLPMESNTIDLDPEVRDRHGLAVPRITHRQHPNDLAMLAWYGPKLREIAEAAGGKQIWEPEVPHLTHLKPDQAMKGSGAHFHGTCRMGDDPAASVVDRWCRCHEVKNLWVVDGSVFPTSGGYNPTLTILANAYRVADHFIAESKRQNL
jgi:choline dehydrogenase-like flavoprotein